ncbi:MAG TPA: hypothetical protein VJ927_06400 [Actinomycetota bacterium]|nr:hypothetical protein [Actinomycetota bacterium]
MFTRDERGIVADWLVKIVIGLAIFGVIGYDVGSILVNTFTLDSAADDIAVGVSLDIGAASRASQYTPDEVWRLAKARVEDEDEGVEGARVAKEGTFIDPTGVVHIKLRRAASTLIVERIGAIEDWARATADGQAGTT